MFIGGQVHVCWGIHRQDRPPICRRVLIVGELFSTVLYSAPFVEKYRFVKCKSWCANPTKMYMATPLCWVLPLSKPIVTFTPEIRRKSWGWREKSSIGSNYITWVFRKVKFQGASLFPDHIPGSGTMLLPRASAPLMSTKEGKQGPMLCLFWKIEGSPRHLVPSPEAFKLPSFGL